MKTYFGFSLIEVLLVLSMTSTVTLLLINQPCYVVQKTCQLIDMMRVLVRLDNRLEQRIQGVQFSDTPELASPVRVTKPCA